MVGGEGEVEGPQVLYVCVLGDEQEEQREAVGVGAGAGFDGRAGEEEPEAGQVGGEAAGLGSGSRRPPARSPNRQHAIQTVLLRAVLCEPSEISFLALHMGPCLLGAKTCNAVYKQCSCGTVVL